MTKQTNTTNPVAAIAICNGRTKDQLPKCGNAYYLRDGQEFIIMLYNPTPRKVAAKIFINGRAEQAMLVLRPGQRAWIERFIDTDRKFKFETYEVDDTAEGRAATADNGKVRVEFYDEAWPQPPQVIYVEKPVYAPVYTPQWPYQPQPWVEQPYYRQQFYCSTNGTGGGTLSCGFTGANGPSGNSSQQVGVCCDSVSAEAPQMETGRVEKGNVSEQRFGVSNDSFNSFYSHVEEFVLMPEKYRPVEKVKAYCVKCGRAQKPGDAYCAACGNKY